MEPGEVMPDGTWLASFQLLVENVDVRLVARLRHSNVVHQANCQSPILSTGLAYRGC